jgi:hypothetical protein
LEPQLTSYDYDAPLTEAGDPTPKYMAIRAVVNNVKFKIIKYFVGKYIKLICLKYLNQEPSKDIPVISSKGAYGKLKMNYLKTLFELLPTKTAVNSEHPLTFEDLDQVNKNLSENF